MSTPFLPKHMTVAEAVKSLLRIYVIALALLGGLMQIGGASNVFGYDVILQVEDMLQAAAKASPQWDSRQDAIRRDVHASRSR